MGLTPPGQKPAVQLHVSESASTHIKRTIQERLELLISIFMDGALIAAAIVVRALLIWLFKKFIPSDDTFQLFLLILEGVVNVGLIFSAATIALFDLAKRVINAWQELRAQ